MVKIMKKYKTKSLKHNTNHKGGAIYSFDLTDKIGGLPARIPLNGTQDGDCPATDTKDLGFVNYGATKGGSRKHKKSKRSKHVSKSRSPSHVKGLPRKNKSKSRAKSRTNRRK
jgi:hypothetical protein